MTATAAAQCIVEHCSTKKILRKRLQNSGIYIIYINTDCRAVFPSHPDESKREKETALDKHDGYFIV